MTVMLSPVGPAESAQWFRQPRGLSILFLTQMWEIFSYYGMRTLLMYYMTKQLMLGQQHAMTGQISAVWNVFLSLPTVAALLAGGALSGILEEKGTDQAVRIPFLVGAAIMFAVAIYSLWRPAEVFDNVRFESGGGQHPFEDIKRLLQHWPIYPALLIWLLWNFAPGSTTPAR